MYWLFYVLQFWLLQFICVRDKKEKTRVGLAGAIITPKRGVTIHGLR